jgi:hypothetical protein
MVISRDICYLGWIMLAAAVPHKSARLGENGLLRVYSVQPVEVRLILNGTRPYPLR